MRAGIIVRNHRVKAGATQQQLADALQLRLNQIQAMENGVNPGCWFTWHRGAIDDAETLLEIPKGRLLEAVMRDEKNAKAERFAALRQEWKKGKA